MKVIARREGLLEPAFRVNGGMLLVGSEWLSEGRNRMEVMAEWSGPYTNWLSRP